MAEELGVGLKVHSHCIIDQLTESYVFQWCCNLWSVTFSLFCREAVDYILIIAPLFVFGDVFRFQKAMYGQKGITLGTPLTQGVMAQFPMPSSEGAFA